MTPSQEALLADTIIHPSAFQKPLAANNVISAGRRRDEDAFLRADYATLELQRDKALKTCWAYMRPPARPSFTMELLRDMRAMQEGIKRSFAEADADNPPFQYFVFASRFPGIYNLGGDLGMFYESIRKRDEDGMRRYAHAAAETGYQNTNAFHLPVITMALVQGDALGGGFEAALSYDIIVAERSAKMGLPEILFNLFPGMGAYSFLSRRASPAIAEKLIMSGQIYTGEKLYEMGIVDVLAEDGEGEKTLREYIETYSRKFNAHQAIYQARRRINPITREEMYDVVDIWVEAALRLKEPDLRKMERLVTAQNRRLASAMPARNVL